MRAPRLACWILRTLGCGPSMDRVLSALIEERLCGRSAWWFWAQTIKALSSSYVVALHRHPALAVRGLLIGLMVMAGFLCLGADAVPFIFSLTEMYLANPLYEIPVYAEAVRTSSTLAVPRQILVIQPLLLGLVVGGSAFLTGWVVALAHDRQRNLVILTVALCSLMVPFGQIVLLPDAALMADALNRELRVGTAVISVVCVIGGGLLVKRRGDEPARW
jgi:hypothetical protein